jgi:hypothetical protein
MDLHLTSFDVEIVLNSLRVPKLGERAVYQYSPPNPKRVASALTVFTFPAGNPKEYHVRPSKYLGRPRLVT